MRGRFGMRDTEGDRQQVRKKEAKKEGEREIYIYIYRERERERVHVLITKVLQHENVVGHIVLRYSATSQCLFSHSDLTLIILIHYLFTTIIQELLTPPSFVLHTLHIPPLPASPPATSMRPTQLYLYYFPLYNPFPLPHM